MPIRVALKELRKKKGLSQNGLAQALGMTLQNVQRIEYGQAKSIPFETLDDLCDILDCDIGDLLIREKDKPESKPTTEEA